MTKPSPEKRREWWISRTEDGDWDVCSVDLSDNKNYVHVIEAKALDAANAEADRLRVIAQDRDAQNLTLTKERDAARAECDIWKSRVDREQNLYDEVRAEAINNDLKGAHYAGLLTAAERALELIAAPITGNTGDKVVCLITIDAWHAIAKDALAKIREGRGE